MTDDRDPTTDELEQLVEPREGMAVVHGPDGVYLGCISVERWARLVEDERERLRELVLEERAVEALERIATALELVRRVRG
jgi:hypothetical protein